MGSEQIISEISTYFGYLPSLFVAAQEKPQVLEVLWEQTLAAYINNPLPTLFKQKLFAYLSRYCNVSYCIVYHSCVLRQLGVSGILQLLKSPAPTEVEIEQIKAHIANSPLTSLPEPDTALDHTIFSYCVYTFLNPQDADSVQLRQILGRNYDHLRAFLAYVKTCHLWVEANPVLAYQIEPSTAAVLSELFVQEPGLVEFFRNYNELIESELKSRSSGAYSAVERTGVQKSPQDSIDYATRLTSGSPRLSLVDSSSMAASLTLGVPQQPSTPVNEIREWMDFANASWGVVVGSADGKLEMMNPAFAKMHGYTVEELVGKSILEVFAPECWVDVPQYIRIAHAQGSYSFDSKHRRKDGSVFPVQVDIAALKDKNEEVLYRVVSVRDISDRILTEQKLIQNEQLFQQLTENIHQVFWIVSRNHDKVFYISPAYEEIWGRPRSLLYDNPASFIDSIHPLDRERIIAARDQPLQAHREIEYRIIRPDNQERWIRDCAFPILNSDGEIERCVGIAEDITERKQLQAELEQSEQRLQFALSAARMGRWEWNILTNEIIWSENLEALFGQEKGSFNGTFESFNECVHPQDREFVQHSVMQAVQTGAEYDIEFRVVWSDGTIRWLASKGHVFRDTTGKPVGMTGVDIDITKRKQVEEQLRLLESVVVNAKDAILITEAKPIDEPGPKIVYVNAAFTRMTGYSSEEILGKTPRLLQGLKTDRATLDKIRTALSSWQPICVELINYRKDGSEFWSEISIVPVTDATGWYTHWVAIQRDISDRKQTDAEYQMLIAAEQAARAAADTANRTKDEFLAIVSHELRSPLNAMLGWVRLLRSRKFDADKTAQALEIIERNARLQAQLIEDLLDISRMIRGKLHLNSSEVNLVCVISAAIDVIRTTAQSKNIQLDFTIEEDTSQESALGTESSNESKTRPSTENLRSLVDDSSMRTKSEAFPVHVWGDPVRLQQVVWNLLSNAVKFTPEGGRVAIRLSRHKKKAGGAWESGRVGEWGNRSNSPPHPLTPSPPPLLTPSLKPLASNPSPITDYARLQVIDTGKGISPEFLPYVFERFRQADSTITRAQNGLGLGLAIVRSLVELHHGSIQVESPGEGQGATFTVQLPLYEGSTQASVGSRKEHSIVVTRAYSSLNGLHILVVDDEVDARELVTTVLEQYGAKVTAVASVAEALDATERLQLDVLVSDIGMPGENGYSLIRKLRNKEAQRGGRIPAIALTAYARSEDREAAIAAGFQIHLPKPVEPTVLAGVVANVYQLSMNNEQLSTPKW